MQAAISLNRRGYRGAGRLCPPPWTSEDLTRGGGTIWLNHCQNSLKTRLRNIKITFSVDFYKKEKEKDLAPALIQYFQRGGKH